MPAGTGYIYELLRKVGLSPFAARTGEFLLVRPLKILLVIAVAWVLGRIAARGIARSIRSLRTRAPLTSTSARAEQRASTLGDVLGSLVRAVIWGIALLTVLDEIGINLAPLLAGAGIAGIAVGFGAQSLVKDVISGLFILLEDQYGVGDDVSLLDANGTVEDLTLRVTRVRAGDGTVWFVPNGEVRKVGNASMEWSRAVIDVPLSFDVDVDRARAIILEEAAKLPDEERFATMVLEAPTDCTVQAMDATTLTLRVVVKTAPRMQFVVARELRARIAARLRHDGLRQPSQPFPPAASPPASG